jgi:hypothetical protein
VRGALIALSVASLACFDVTEEISIREDGSARYSLDVAIPQDAVSLGDREAAEALPGAGQPADLGSAFRRIGEDARRLSREADAVSGFDVSESIDGCGFHHFLLTMDVRDATQLASAQQTIFGAVAGGPRSASRRKRPLRPDLRVEDLGDESLGILRLLPEDGLVGSSDEPAGVIARALGESALAGHELRVIVRGPHVVSANGAIAEDRRSVSWSVPLSDVVTGAAFPLELRAEVRLPHPVWPFLGLLLVTGLLAGVAAIIWLRRREPATWRN